jgi:predicted outer membrane repeat protein
MLAWALAVAALAACVMMVFSSTRAGATAQGARTLHATITVTSTEDSGPGSLRAAIENAASGDTINFSVTDEIQLTSGTLTINKDLSIVGPGADELRVWRRSDQYFKIFQVESGVTATISGLYISEGAAFVTRDDAGGGVDNNGTLTLDSCQLTNNGAYHGGGGALRNRGTMILKHCQVVNNLSEGQGGGILNQGMMTVSDSLISQNTAGNTTGDLSAPRGDGGGGGIANSGTLAVNNTTFMYNSARTGGGALLNSGHAVINNNTIVNNYCGYGRNPSVERGGGIYNDGGDLSINASTIMENSVRHQSTDTPPTEKTRGGGVYNNSGTVSVATSIIAGNSVIISQFVHDNRQDIAGAFISKGYNLIGVEEGGTGFSNGVQHDQTGKASAPLNPKVGMVRDNGGPTPTAALLCGSPAIDAGDDAVLEPPLDLATDQRGRVRRAGSHVDIGAFEVQPDDETCRALSISDAVVVEGDTGTKNAVFTVTLSAATADGVTFRYSTISDSAHKFEDFSPITPFDPGFATIAGGVTSKTINVPIIGDRIFEPDETFTVVLSHATNAVIARAQGVGTITNDDPPPVIQFSAANYQVNETGGSVLVTITRTGNMLGEILVNYTTSDDSADLPCNDTTTAPYTASARCDYTTMIHRLFFHHNETELSFAVPIIDDAHMEQAESFKVFFSVSSGAPLDTESQATVTIIDNDTGAGKNPIDDNAFFVRQHYLDFLNREPEQAGFDAWMSVLNRCPNRFNFDPASPSAACDRITVSAAFFNSPEFRAKTYLIYRFYRVALNRRPHYDEIIRESRSLTWQNEVEASLRRSSYAASWVLRPEFRARYDALTNTEYVDALFERYSGMGNIPPSQRISRELLIVSLLPGFSTRADILLKVVESREVDAVEYNGAFVAMQYFGYLRRDAEETGYAAWLNYLNTHPGDYRTMVHGFLNSQEYRLRFGAPQ